MGRAKRMDGAGSISLMLQNMPVHFRWLYSVLCSEVKEMLKKGGGSAMLGSIGYGTYIKNTHQATQISSPTL